MTKIELFEGYYIEAEDENGHNFILKREREHKKGGKAGGKLCGYFSTFGGALKGFRRECGRKLIHEHATTIAEVVHILEDLDKRIEGLINSKRV